MSAMIFISYKREDERFARHLHNTLTSWGYSVWLDVLDIEAGSNWDSSIHQAMQAADTVIGILTPASLSSRNVLDEWGYALSSEKRLLLLWLKDIREADIPPRYIRIQRIDFRQNESIALEKLHLILLGKSSSELKLIPQRPISILPLLLGSLAVMSLLLLGIFLLWNNISSSASPKTSPTSEIPATVAPSDITASPTLSPSPEASLTPSHSSSITPSVLISPSTQPIASSTVSASPSPNLATYPCAATIVSGGSMSSELNIIHSQALSSSTIIRRIRVNSSILILDKSIEGTRITWYQIATETEQTLGWVTEDYVSLSNQCPDY